MSYLPYLIFLHILLMVFWVGTDVGVFMSALRYINPKLSLVERAGCMSLGIAVDRYPRICFVGMLPVGITIASMIGFFQISTGVLTLIWLSSAVWMFIVLKLISLHGGPGSKPWQMVERVFLVVYMLGLLGFGFAGFGGWLAIPGWLAGKLICFGLICFFGLALDHSFKPVVAAYMAIESQGSTPERESVLTTRMWISLRWVLAIYAAVLTAGFLGTVKP